VTSWADETRRIRARLEAARSAGPHRTFDPAELEGLPRPVKRFFQTALTPGQPVVSAATITHQGTLNTSTDGESWRRFTSTQRVITHRPGFDWDARVAMLPGLTVRVHDTYVKGEGILHAALFGMFDMENVHDTAGMAMGELMRFLAEAAWYPTALLPSQGVRWMAVDDTSARARLTDGDLSVVLLFRFSDAGTISSVRADARGRTVKGRAVPTPWEGIWWQEERRDGMLIPISGEVSWLLPERRLPYWRGRITDLRYEYATEGVKA